MSQFEMYLNVANIAVFVLFVVICAVFLITAISVAFSELHNNTSKRGSAASSDDASRNKEELILFDAAYGGGRKFEAAVSEGDDPQADYTFSPAVRGELDALAEFEQDRRAFKREWSEEPLEQSGRVAEDFPAPSIKQDDRYFGPDSFGGEDFPSNGSEE